MFIMDCWPYLRDTAQDYQFIHLYEVLPDSRLSFFKIALVVSIEKIETTELSYIKVTFLCQNYTL